MHPALQNSTVVSAIVRELQFNFADVKHRRACIALGLSCRSFLSAALDELWRELFDLDHLIKVIDGIDTIELSGIGGAKPRRQYFLDRLISSKQIERLLYYSRRVEVFYHQDKSGTELFASIDPSIISQIVSLLPSDEPLFPSLRRLHLATGAAEHTVSALFPPYISKLFLSTTLKSVSFGLSGSQTLQADVHSPNVWLFLQGVSRMRPQMLQNLDLGFVLHPRHLKPCFEFFTCLEFLKLPTGSYSLETLGYISRLPNLLSLSVVLGDWTLDCEHLPDRKMCFERLIILLLDSSVEATRSLLSHFCFPELDKLELSHVDRDMMHDDAWQALVEQIADDLPNLGSLKFDYHSRDPKQGLQLYQTFPWTRFDRLLQLRSLTDLSICTPKVESLSNEDFSAMADAWRDLTHLRIDTDVQGDITYQALLTVAYRLPHLRSLVLSLDMPGAWVPMLPIAPHMLRRLQIPSLKDEEEAQLTPLSMEEQCEIAHFLDTLFPYLDVKSFYESGRGRSGVGASMDKLVQHLQDAGKRRLMMRRL